MSLLRVLLLALSEVVLHVQLLRGMSGPELKFLRGKIQAALAPVTASAKRERSLSLLGA